MKPAPSRSRGGATAERALAFLACPPAHVETLLAGLRAAWPDAEWDVVGFYRPAVAWRDDMRFVPSTGGLRFAIGLWLRALRARYRRAVICADDTARLGALRVLIAYVALLPVRRRELLDRHGARMPLSAATLRDTIGAAVTAGLVPLARLVTRLGLALVPPSPVPARRRPRRPGRTALVVPILPDLSHTFVYREALALVRRHPEWTVLVLERGVVPVLHREAAELAAIARDVPALSPREYLTAYLRHWIVRPRAIARLIRAFMPHTATFGPEATPHDPLAFLQLEYLGHSNHVAPGLVFAEHLRREGISDVHVWGATYPAVRALIAWHLLDVRVSVSTFVDFDYATPFHMLREKLDAAEFVVACTAFCAARLHAVAPALDGKVRVLRHALPRDYAAGKAARPADGRSRLVYVGRFVPKKGLDTLVEAVRRLHEGGVRVSCHLYGAGEEEARLRRLARELRVAAAVHFEGPIANQDLYRAMNADDVFVCPSRETPDGERDGIPVTLLEAMAAGITVVATRVSGIPELVKDGVNGYLVEPGDPAALAGTLARVLGSRDARARVADAARRTVRERFALEDAAATLAGWISRESASRA